MWFYRCLLSSSVSMLEACRKSNRLSPTPGGCYQPFNHGASCYVFTLYATIYTVVLGGSKHLISFTVYALACFQNCVQEEQLYTWASVGLPVSSHLWELYGGRFTGREQSLRSPLHQSSAKTPGALRTQVGYIPSSPINILQCVCPVYPSCIMLYGLFCFTTNITSSFQ